MDVIVTSPDGEVVKSIPVNALNKFLKNGWTSDNAPVVSDDVNMSPMNAPKQRGRPREL